MSFHLSGHYRFHVQENELHPDSSGFPCANCTSERAKQIQSSPLCSQLQTAEEFLKEHEAKLKESEEEHSSDLENALIRLEEEQQRLVHSSL